MHPLSWRGANGKDPTLLCKKIARAPGGVKNIGPLSCGAEIDPNPSSCDKRYLSVRYVNSIRKSQMNAGDRS